MKVSIELPEIDGYEFTGEYRAPKKGEWILGDTSSVLHVSGGWTSSRHILKKKAPVYIESTLHFDGRGSVRLVEIKALEVALDMLSPITSHLIDKELETYNQLRELL